MRAPSGCTHSLLHQCLVRQIRDVDVQMPLEPLPELATSAPPEPAIAGPASSPGRAESASHASSSSREPPRTSSGPAAATEAGSSAEREPPPAAVEEPQQMYRCVSFPTSRSMPTANAEDPLPI